MCYNAKYMGKLEEESKRRKSKHDIQKVILTAVEIAGVISLALIAPNTTKLLKSFGYDPKDRHKEIVKRSKDRLVKSGLLAYENGFIKLTEKGTAKLRLLESKEWKFEKPKKWDGKWRMLIFDIPENRRSLREKIRITLLDIGFSRLQDSVWIYPYACEDLINLLKADFRVGKDVLYIIADSIENDKSLRRYFNLPSALV